MSLNRRLHNSNRRVCVLGVVRPDEPEIRDQLWILDRVHQQYPNNSFFDQVFGSLVALSHLVGRFGQSRNT